MKKPSISSIQKQIWQECRRLSGVSKATHCFTCHRPFEVEGKKVNKQLGHFIPKVFLPMELKYDLRYLRPQCYFCNINLGGSGALFYYNLVTEIGQKEVDKLFLDYFVYKDEDKRTEKEKREFYLDLLEEYKKTP